MATAVKAAKAAVPSANPVGYSFDIDAEGKYAFVHVSSAMLRARLRLASVNGNTYGHVSLMAPKAKGGIDIHLGVVASLLPAMKRLLNTSKAAEEDPSQEEDGAEEGAAPKDKKKVLSPESKSMIQQFMADVQYYWDEEAAFREECIEKGFMRFDWLHVSFETGDRVTYFGGQDMSGMSLGSLKSDEPTVSYTDYPDRPAAVFRYTHLRPNADYSSLIATSGSFELPVFEGLIEDEELPIRHATDEQLKHLEERGNIYRDLFKGSHYLHYDGYLVRELGRGFSIPYTATGRVMIDLPSFKFVQPAYFGLNRPTYGQEDGKDVDIDDLIFTLPASVYGFSFRARTWGSMKIEGLSEATFNEQADELLVMEKKTKKRIFSLVRHSTRDGREVAESAEGSKTDIIAGKGGGCIILLHGDPGLGKTLTAEVSAEKLKRPLLSLSAGDLGHEPEVIEKNLSTYLQVATTWRAVLLIDEADVYLTQRDVNDIKRNAIVATFLRLLEYYDGVLFLTTNMQKDIDRAFASRFSAIVRFVGRTPEEQSRIWETQLGIREMDADTVPREIRQAALNGRQIRNIINNAVAFAADEDRVVSASDFQEAFELAAPSVAFPEEE